MKNNIISSALSNGSYSEDGTAIANNVNEQVKQIADSNPIDMSRQNLSETVQKQRVSSTAIGGSIEIINQRTRASAIGRDMGDKAGQIASSSNIISPTKHRSADSSSSSSSSGPGSNSSNDSPSRASALSSIRAVSDDLYSRTLDGRLKSLSESKIQDRDCKVKDSFLSPPAAVGTEGTHIMGEVSVKLEKNKDSKLPDRTPLTSAVTPQYKKPSNTSVIAIVLAYIGFVVASYLCGVHPSLDYSNPVSQSPWVGEHNATKLINQRLQLIEERYQGVMVRDGWKMLRMSPNVTIETMSSEDGSWPGYIRTSAIFQAKPDDILKYLGWLQFDETQKKVDRFHESSYLLFAPSHKSKVIRKVS